MQKTLWNERHAEGTVFIDNKKISEMKSFILGFNWFSLIYMVRCICDSKNKIMCTVVHKETFMQGLFHYIFDN